MCRRSLLDRFGFLLVQVCKILQFPQAWKNWPANTILGQVKLPGHILYKPHIPFPDSTHYIPCRGESLLGSQQQTTTSRKRSSSLFERPVIVHSNLSWLGGGFQHFLFSPLFGEYSHFDEYFSKGLVQPPTSHGVSSCKCSSSPFLKTTAKRNATWIMKFYPRTTRSHVENKVQSWCINIMQYFTPFTYEMQGIIKCHHTQA